LAARRRPANDLYWPPRGELTYVNAPGTGIANRTVGLLEGGRLHRKSGTMDYRGFFEDAVDALRQEKRYRVFADLERIAGRFPRAIYRDAADNQREITIW
jgi:5-aminolevulinate synthase